MKKRGLLRILLFCLSIAIALLLCEAVLQFALPSTQSKDYYIWPPHHKTVFKPYQDVMLGISGDSLFLTNSHGIRGDELAPQHSYRILAIGGSTTQCSYLDQSETWTNLIQETLNRKAGTRKVWVGNGGVSGTTTRHHLTAMQYLPLNEMKVDAVILLMGINDLSRRLSHDKGYDPDFLEKHEARKELLAQTFAGTFQFYPEDPLYKKTALWQLMRKMKQLMSREHVEDEGGRIYNTWREHRRRASEIRNELPDLSSALEEYARNIDKIIDLARTKSVRPILATQPTLWRSDLPQNLDALLWLGGVGDFQEEVGKPYYSAAALEKGMKAYNDALLRVCRERRIECVDLASILEKDTTVFYDDVHFNESGARKVAEALSRYLLERGLFLEAQVAK